jgi:hypothetical protein
MTPHAFPRPRRSTALETRARRLARAVPWAIALLLVAFASPALAGEESCPLHAQHVGQAAGAHGEEAHRAEVDARGDVAMGFSQHATTHHFRLAADGGAIEVTVRDAADTATREAVRTHLQAIAAAFAGGDFSIPEAVHAQLPPGAVEMRAAGGAIRYGYEELPAGGRVVLAAATPEAVAAVHDFLRFQIAEHETGDPSTVAP